MPVVAEERKTVDAQAEKDALVQAAERDRGLANGLALLEPMRNGCLYLRQGWFTYSFWCVRGRIAIGWNLPLTRAGSSPPATAPRSASSTRSASPVRSDRPKIQTRRRTRSASCQNRLRSSRLRNTDPARPPSSGRNGSPPDSAAAAKRVRASNGTKVDGTSRRRGRAERYATRRVCREKSKCRQAYPRSLSQSQQSLTLLLGSPVPLQHSVDRPDRMDPRDFE